ncbi:hypothetical protein Tco_0669092 [Tanacetum coccineum]
MDYFISMHHRSDGGWEAEKASKRRRSLLDYKIQQLSKGSSEGFGIIPEVPDDAQRTNYWIAQDHYFLNLIMKDISNDEEFKAALRIKNLMLTASKTSPTPQPYKLMFKCVRPPVVKTVQENLESFMSGRVRDIDYKLIQRIE